jgi:hypothetical protein
MTRTKSHKRGFSQEAASKRLTQRALCSADLAGFENLVAVSVRVGCHGKETAKAASHPRDTDSRFRTSAGFKATASLVPKGLRCVPR